MAKAKKVTTPVQEMAAQPTEAPSVDTPAQLEPVQLTIANLQVLAKIIDVASRRGAFQAAELSQVGEAYNTLSGFLAYVEQEQAKAAPAAPTETE